MIELLAVMTILAILIGMTFGLYPMVTKWSKDKKTIAQLKMLELALEQFNQEHGYYPQTSSPTDPESLTKTWFENLVDENGKPYLDLNHFSIGQPVRNPSLSETYVDAYAMEYYYQCPGIMNPEKYDLWSTGKDRSHGALDDSMPIDPKKAQMNDPDTINSDDLTNWRPF